MARTALWIHFLPLPSLNEASPAASTLVYSRKVDVNKKWSERDGKGEIHREKGIKDQGPRNEEQGTRNKNKKHGNMPTPREINLDFVFGLLLLLSFVQDKTSMRHAQYRKSRTRTRTVSPFEKMKTTFIVGRMTICY
jgi:hypothetical protein